MCAKIRKLKVATQYFALKTLNRESYFLRKWNFFLKKPKKMQKNKKTFFSFTTPHYHLTLRYVRKKNSEKFSEPVLYEFSQI